MIDTLVDRGYDPDPVKKWKAQQKSSLLEVRNGLAIRAGVSV